MTLNIKKGMIQMKNKLKKVLCTALAAVSLSAIVTVPSSLNKPNSDNSFVNVIEADAEEKANFTDYRIYVWNALTQKQEAHPLMFHLSIDKLNGRRTPDGEILHTFKKGVDDGILISKIRIERYKKGVRIWGYTYDDYVCEKDNKKHRLWVCLYRTDSNPNEQCPCTDPTYRKDMNRKLIDALYHPADYLKSETKLHRIYCGSYQVSFL